MYQVAPKTTSEKSAPANGERAANGIVSHIFAPWSYTIMGDQNFLFSGGAPGNERNNPVLAAAFHAWPGVKDNPMCLGEMSSVYINDLPQGSIWRVLVPLPNIVQHHRFGPVVMLQSRIPRRRNLSSRKHPRRARTSSLMAPTNSKASLPISKTSCFDPYFSVLPLRSRVHCRLRRAGVGRIRLG